MTLEDTNLSKFLTEREGRIKPNEANSLGLKRIEKIDFSGNIHLEDSTETRTDMIRIKNGDLVISGINAAKGAIAVYEGDEDILATIHYSCYEYNPDLISINFLKWFFKSRKFNALLKEQVSGGIKTELKPKHILPLKVKVPNLARQLSIAEKLDKLKLNTLKIDFEIEKQQSQLAILKKSILKEALQGKLTSEWRESNLHSAEEIFISLQKAKGRTLKALKVSEQKSKNPEISITPFEIPNSWKWCYLADIAYVGTGATPAKDKAEYYSRGTIPWITSSATGSPFVKIASSMITELALKETNCSVYPKHTLLIAMYGQGKTRGQVTELLIDAATNQACAAIVIPEEHLATIKYIKLVAEENYQRIRMLAQGGAQPNLNLSKIKSSLIPLPPLEEQELIVSKVESLMTSHNEFGIQIANAKKLSEQFWESRLFEIFDAI